jgi:hypothetical protein
MFRKKVLGKNFADFDFFSSDFALFEAFFEPVEKILNQHKILRFFDVLL